MNKEETIKLYEYFDSMEEVPEEMMNIYKKLDIIVKQIKLNDSFQESMEQLTKELNEIK